MAEVEFDPDDGGVTLRLAPMEYRFLDCAMEYVLYGVKVPEFESVMVTPRVDAEDLFQRLHAMEREAKRTREHW